MPTEHYKSVIRAARLKKRYKLCRGALSVHVSVLPHGNEFMDINHRHNKRVQTRGPTSLAAAKPSSCPGALINAVTGLVRTASCSVH